MAFDPKKLREMLDEKGISQLHLAGKVGTDRRTVSRWLNGKRPPKETNIRAIAEFFGCDPWVFDPSFSEEGEVAVYAKVSTASHNALTIMQMRYGVSQKDILELAPVLFAVVADLALEVPARDEERARNGYVPYWDGRSDRQEGFFCFDKPAAQDGKCFGLPPERPDMQETRNLFFTALQRLCAEGRNVAAMPWVEPSEVPTAKGFNPDAAWISKATSGDLHLTYAVTTGRVRLSTVLNEHAQGAGPVADLLYRDVQKFRSDNLRKLANWRAWYWEHHPDEAREYEEIVEAHCHPDGWYPDHYSDDTRAECWADPFREDRHIDAATLPAYQTARNAGQGPGTTIRLVLLSADPVYQRFEQLKQHRTASKHEFEEADE